MNLQRNEGSHYVSPASLSCSASQGNDPGRQDLGILGAGLRADLAAPSPTDRRGRSGRRQRLRSETGFKRVGLGETNRGKTCSKSDA